MKKTKTKKAVRSKFEKFLDQKDRAVQRHALQYERDLDRMKKVRDGAWMYYTRVNLFLADIKEYQSEVAELCWDIKGQFDVISIRFSKTRSWFQIKLKPTRESNVKTFKKALSRAEAIREENKEILRKRAERLREETAREKRRQADRNLSESVRQAIIKKLTAEERKYLGL